jgi:hypothetical protein
MPLAIKRNCMSGNSKSVFRPSAAVVLQVQTMSARIVKVAIEKEPSYQVIHWHRHRRYAKLGTTRLNAHVLRAQIPNGMICITAIFLHKGNGRLIGFTKQSLILFHGPDIPLGIANVSNAFPRNIYDVPRQPL